MRKVTKVEIASLPAVVVSLRDFNKTSTTWFDGTPESLVERQQKVYSLTHSCSSLLADSHLEEDEAALVQSWKSDLEREAATLSEAEFDIAEARFQDDYNELPNFSVMASSLEYKASQEKDWEKYVELEPTKFIQANADSLVDADEIRYRAIREVLDKTAGMEDENLKSYVVDNFVNKVEALRQEMYSPEMLVKSASVESIPDEWLLI